jgi:methylmalonyl-CoA decarboxylase
MSFVLTSTQEEIGWITLNHEAKRNALSGTLIHAVIEALATFKQQRLRVVILRAQPGAKVWSAGHDVAELPESRRDPLGWDDPLRSLIREIEMFPAPVIAMIEGTVWGGACETAFACDLIVAAPNVTFAITPAKLGVPYNVSGMVTFLNAASLRIAKEMAFTAQPMTADRAERRA